MSWSHEKTKIDAGPSGTVRTLFCDPLPLWATGEDSHKLIHRCTGCGNDTLELSMKSNVKWKWEVLSGGGHFAKVTDGDEGAILETQQALYIPPDLAVGEETMVSLEVRMIHDDSIKAPGHADAVVTFAMIVSRAIRTEVGAIGDAVLEKELDEYVYMISTEKQTITNPPDPGGEVGSRCTASHNWKKGVDITSGFAPPNEQLYTKDYVLLEATGCDSDNLELHCTPDQENCFQPGFVALNLNDVLEYTWTASGGTFPGGNVGKEVVYQAPEIGGPVMITLEVKNVGNRFDDSNPKPVVETLDIQILERKVQASAIAWIDKNDIRIANLPTESDLPPNDTDAFLMAPQAFVKIQTTPTLGRLSYSFAHLNNKWRLYLWIGNTWDSRGLPFHPWFHASKALRDSSNSTPPSQFSSFDELKGWLESQEYRAVLGFKARALVRRGNLVCVPTEDMADFDAIVDEGWTPIRGFSALVVPNRLVAEIISGIGLNQFERGEFRDKVVTISGICTDEITIEVRQQMRIGRHGNTLNKLFTNRDGPWISPVLTVKIKADQDPVSGDMDLSVSPQFPTWDTFFGEPSLQNVGRQFPGERQIDFINRGAKINKKGV